MILSRKSDKKLTYQALDGEATINEEEGRRQEFFPSKVKKKLIKISLNLTIKK